MQHLVTTRRASASSALGLSLALVFGSSGMVWADTGFLVDPRAEEMIAELAAEGMDAEQIRSWLGQGEYLETTRTSIAAPRERTATWADYRPIFVNDLSVERGRAFIAENAEALQRAEDEFGVDKHVIAAIIGVETRYGRITGNHNVLNAIGTTAFGDSRRADYFQREMKALLRLAVEEQVNPLELTGSYAGAMGVPQFMPSSFTAYAVDFNGDGKRDIWSNTEDAIGSVANYLARHNWETDGPVVSRANVAGDNYLEQVDNSQRRPHTPVSATFDFGWSPSNGVVDSNDRMASTFQLEGDSGAEFWYGFQNLYVITRYNHSLMYAMAVHQLSQEF